VNVLKASRRISVHLMADELAAKFSWKEREDELEQIHNGELHPLEKQVVPLLVDIQQHVRSLKQDVDAMRLHVLQLEAAQQGGAPLPPPGPVALPPLLSDLPLRTLRDVEEAERLLADVSKLQLLGKGSKALQRCVQILVRLLLTNDLQRNYSLAGRQKKHAFKELRMGKLLLAAVEEKTGQDSDSVEKAVGRYLAGAPARAKEAAKGSRAPQDELDGSSGSTAMTAVTIKTVGPVRDKALPQANVVCLHNGEWHGIATWPVQPERPDVGGKSRQLYELFLGGFDYATTDPRVTWGGEERCVRSEDATSRALGCTEVAVQCPEHGLDRCFLKSGPS
ncbi:hypothetical protein HPB47_027287, partial [Ixodes persulcatus]